MTEKAEANDSIGVIYPYACITLIATTGIPDIVLE